MNRLKTFPIQLLTRIMVQVSAIIILAAVAGCSKSSDPETEQLLATVPRNAGGVVVAHPARILQTLGCKIEGSEVILTPELKEACKETSGSDKLLIDILMGSNTGVNRQSVVLFQANGLYLSGLITEVSMFQNYVKREFNFKASGNGEIESVGELAFNNERFWISLGSLPDTAELDKLLKQKKSASFLEEAGVDKLLEGDFDIAVLTDIATATRSASGQISKLPMVIGGVFDNPSHVFATARFGKQTLEAIGELLNDKGAPAAFRLPTGKIDTSLFSMLGNGGEMVFGIAVPNEMITKLMQFVGQFGMSLPEPMSAAIGSLDGTIAVVMGANDTIQGAIQTNGTQTQMLQGLTESFTGLPVVCNGGTVVFNAEANLDGAISPRNAATDLKDAMGGLVADLRDLGLSEQPGRKFVFTVVPEEGSLIFKAKANVGADAMLKTLLR